MMVYDAFAKRVILPNKQIINWLASIMMLLNTLNIFCDFCFSLIPPPWSLST